MRHVSRIIINFIEKHVGTTLLRERELAELKDKHRNEILDAAMQLCLEQGVADVDMKEVAAAARVSRATLYRYFPSKQELVYHVLRRLAAEAATEYHAERMLFSGNGYEKFSQFIMQLVDTCNRFPNLYRFMGMTDFYYGTQDSAKELAQLYQDVFQGLLVGDTPHLYLEEGQRDGSVRTDIDARVFTSTTIAAVVGLAEQVMATPEVTQLVYDLDNPNQVIKNTAWAFLQAIRTSQ